MSFVGVLGASGMAREVGDIAWANGQEPVYVTHRAEELASWAFKHRIILESELDQPSNMKFVIGIGDNAIRRDLAFRFEGKLQFISLIHPSVTLGFGQLEMLASCKGVVVCAGARLTNNILIGNFTIVNQNVCIAHDVIVDDFVHIAPGACISGNVHIGERSWIGAGAVVNQGQNNRRLEIGAGAVIASGAVVLTDCEPNAVYAGVPARRIR